MQRIATEQHTNMRCMIQFTLCFSCSANSHCRSYKHCFLAWKNSQCPVRGCCKQECTVKLLLLFASILGMVTSGTQSFKMPSTKLKVYFKICAGNFNIANTSTSKNLPKRILHVTHCGFLHILSEYYIIYNINKYMRT